MAPLVVILVLLMFCVACIFLYSSFTKKDEECAELTRLAEEHNRWLDTVSFLPPEQAIELIQRHRFSWSEVIECQEKNLSSQG